MFSRQSRKGELGEWNLVFEAWDWSCGNDTQIEIEKLNAIGDGHAAVYVVVKIQSYTM